MLSHPDTDPSGIDQPDSGKQLWFVYQYEQDRHVHSKECLDVVTTDGTVYAWSRFSDDEPFTFDQRIKPDGRPDGSRRPLPNVVKQAIESHDETVRYR